MKSAYTSFALLLSLFFSNSLFSQTVFKVCDVPLAERLIQESSYREVIYHKFTYRSCLKFPCLPALEALNPLDGSYFSSRTFQVRNSIRLRWMPVNPSLQAR